MLVCSLLLIEHSTFFELHIGIILQLQLDIASYLAAHAMCQYVPVICEYRDEQPGDALFDDYVTKHLKGQIPKNGKFGLCVIISVPVSTTTAANAPGPIENLALQIQVVENTANNRAATTGTGIRADDMYEFVKRALHLYCPDQAHDLIVVRGEQDLALINGLRGFIIELESKAHALDALAKVAMPAITVSGASMTLSSSTAGAAIYWTHDGSFPSAANASAALYNGAVDAGELPADTVIRAAAYLEPLRGSDCAFATL